MEITVNGVSYQLKSGWIAGNLINEAVGDPVIIVRDHVTQQQMSEMGINYSPSIEFGLLNSVKIVHAGAVAGGANLTVEEIGDEYIGDKLPELIELAQKFIFSFMDGAVDLGEGKKETGKKPK